MLITEHGIYTRERDMELALTNWIDSPPHHTYQLDLDEGVFQSWWMGMFRFISRFTYHNADRIISITQVNQEFQLRDGAEPPKLQLISNRINVERFKKLKSRPRANLGGSTVAFLGRV